MERILKKRRGEGGIVPHHLTRNLSRWVSREHLGGQVDDRCVGDQVVDTATVLSEDVEAIDDKIDQADARQTGDQPVDEHSEDAATEESSRRSRVTRSTIWRIKRAKLPRIMIAHPATKREADAGSISTSAPPAAAD